MQPRKQTPSQSMLRRPAASAAGTAFAGTATRDNRCSTLSLGGELHIALFPSVSGAYASGSPANRFPIPAAGATCDESIKEGGTESRIHGLSRRNNRGEPIDG